MQVTASWGGEAVAVEVDAECRSVDGLKRCLQEALPKVDVEAVRLEVCGRPVDDEAVLGLVEGSVIDVSASQAALAADTLREEGRAVDFDGFCRVAEAGDVRLCKLYLEAGVVWPSGVENPLHIAVTLSDETLAKLLLDAGCARDLQDSDGDTPLHVASFANEVQLCKLLIDAGCATNVRNSGGDTPLHIACARHDTQVAELLLDSGCAKNVKNDGGTTPLCNCMEGTKLHAYLLSRGCSA